MRRRQRNDPLERDWSAAVHTADVAVAGTPSGVRVEVVKILAAWRSRAIVWARS